MTEPARPAPPKTPRWVKVSALVVGVLILVAVVVLVTGIGGDHGPTRHLDAVAAGTQR